MVAKARVSHFFECSCLYAGRWQMGSVFKCSRGKEKEHLCHSHFTTLIGLDDREDADWRMPR